MKTKYSVYQYNDGETGTLKQSLYLPPPKNAFSIYKKDFYNKKEAEIFYNKVIRYNELEEKVDDLKEFKRKNFLSYLKNKINEKQFLDNVKKTHNKRDYLYKQHKKIIPNYMDKKEFDKNIDLISLKEAKLVIKEQNS